MVLTKEQTPSLIGNQSITTIPTLHCTHKNPSPKRRQMAILVRRFSCKSLRITIGKAESTKAEKAERAIRVLVSGIISLEDRRTTLHVCKSVLDLWMPATTLHAFVPDFVCWTALKEESDNIKDIINRQDEYQNVYEPFSFLCHRVSYQA